LATSSPANRAQQLIAPIAAVLVVIAGLAAAYFSTGTPVVIRFGIVLGAVAIALGVLWVAQTSPYSVRDRITVIGVVLVVIAGVVAFYYFENSPLLARLGIVLGTVVVGLGLGWTTQLGKSFYQYCQDSLTEAKKVVWPSRKETLQTTGVVVAFVFVMAIFLWMVDAGLLWITQKFLGQGG